MAKMRPPKVIDQPPPVIREEQLRALLGRIDKGKDFLDRRDTAILRIFIDTGARLAEVAGLRWASPSSQRTAARASAKQPPSAARVPARSLRGVTCEHAP
jgi:site-specific recombinase XerC